MNILVVDDEPALRQLMRRILEREFNAVVLEADDGVTALDRLLKEPVDLVLLDLSLKMMGGIETLEAIRRSDTYTHLPVVLMTALADEQHVRRAGELGIDGFIVKPFTPASLRERLTGIISERQLGKRPASAAPRFLEIKPSHRALVLDKSPEFRALASRELSRLCNVEETEDELLATRRCLSGAFNLLVVGATADRAGASGIARELRARTTLRRIRLVAAVAPEEIPDVQGLALFDAVVARSPVEKVFARSLNRALSQDTLVRLLFHPASSCVSALWEIIERGMSCWVGSGVTLHEAPQTPTGDARWISAAVEVQTGQHAWELRMRVQYPLAIALNEARNPGTSDRVSERQIGIAVGQSLEELADTFRALLLARGLTARTVPARIMTAGATTALPALKNTDSRRWLVTSKQQVVPIELAAIAFRQTPAAASRPIASPATRALDHAH